MIKQELTKYVIRDYTEGEYFTKDANNMWTKDLGKAHLFNMKGHAVNSINQRTRYQSGNKFVGRPVANVAITPVHTTLKILNP